MQTTVKNEQRRHRRQLLAERCAVRRHNLGNNAVFIGVAIFAAIFLWQNSFIGKLFSDILITLPIIYSLGCLMASTGLNLSKHTCFLLASAALAVASVALCALAAAGW